MFGQVHGGPEIGCVGNTVGGGSPSAGKGESVGARDQAAERLVQRRARSCGAVGERSDQLYPLEVIAAQAEALGGRGGADPLVPQVVEVRAAGDIGQCPIDNQTGCRRHHRAGFIVRSIDRQAQRNGTRRRGGQERLVDGVQLVVCVSLVVIEELVVAEDGSRRDSKVHSQAVGVHGCVPVLQKRSFRTLVDAAV